MLRNLLVLAVVIGSSSILLAQFHSYSQTAALRGPEGHILGKVTVTGAPHGVLIRIEAKDLTPGWHGVHLHEKAQCDGPSFQSAGGHIHSGTPVVHGLLDPKANDSGDLPNIYVDPNGTVTVELYSTLVSLDGNGGLPALRDSDGSALVIHAKPDDYHSQPIGGAGDRVACAAIR